MPGNPKAVEEKKGPFDKEVILCATCGENEATHQISIGVQKGIDYNHSKQLYHVTYSVCGPCAREVVEVKLGAKLNAKERRA